MSQIYCKHSTYRWHY